MQDLFILFILHADSILLAKELEIASTQSDFQRLRSENQKLQETSSIALTSIKLQLFQNIPNILKLFESSEAALV